MAVISQKTLLRALHWAWSRAEKGLPGQESAASLAARHMDPAEPLEKRLRALAKSHKRRAAATGFLANCGGLALLPAGLAANLAGTLFVQVRMVQAMAIVCGHDLADPRVRALCGLCLCGSKAAEVAAAGGAALGGKVTAALFERLGADTVRRINELVGLRLVAQLGETGLLGASRLAPVVGGLVGASINVAATAGIAQAAMALLADTPARPAPAD
ncbi:MAG: EcsC family protein [Solidesulfovibrio sp. DCME]|uniref:EcsC family protein n=1 Tax=Solidesulfovibrio sp. DCME TaxID=3447380 RepID=UPI003D0C0705